MQHQKVADLNRSNEILDLLIGAGAITTLDNAFTCCRHHDNNGRVNNGQARQYSQNDEPEPQENVDFLIENVERQHTKGVVLLDAARRSVLVENAFGDARENLHHWIGAILLIHVGEFDDFGAVGQEGAAQEFVHEENVEKHIDKVESLTEEIAEGVGVV